MQVIMLRAVKYLGFAALALAVATSGEAAKFRAGSLKGTFVFQLHGVTSFAPFYDGTAGKTNSGIATAPRQDILRVGVFTSDGKGNLVGRTIATTDDGISTVVIDYNWTGTYSVSTNRDGTGTMTINAPTGADINSCKSGDGTSQSGCEAFEGVETYAIVISGDNKGKAVGMIQTDNAGGGAKIFLTGGARTQSTSKGGGGSSFPFPF
ncbi:MAG: hypothetical protein ABSA97_15130 [Verrucomicrobiia bacterium]